MIEPKAVPPPTVIVTTPEELREIVRAAVAEAMASNRSKGNEQRKLDQGNPTTGPTLLTILKVSEQVSLSRRTVWRRLCAKTFPPPLRSEGRTKMWLSTTIDRFVECGYPFPPD